MINNHEKLIEAMLENRLSTKGIYGIFRFFKHKGYKGTKNEVISDMLGAMSYTTAYLWLGGLTEKEYFEILIKEMNINY